MALGAAGDPRLSVEERYPSFGEYYSEAIRAIDGLVKDRFMLCEDADDQQARLLQAGLNAASRRPTATSRPTPCRRTATILAGKEQKD